MTIDQITSLIAAHTHGLTAVAEPVEESLEVRVHGMKLARQEAFNQALGLK